MAGRLSCIKGTASSLGREELLNSGMGLAVCSQLGLCVRVRRGPRVLWASFRCAPLSDLEHPSFLQLQAFGENLSFFSGYCVTVSLVGSAFFFFS